MSKVNVADVAAFDHLRQRTLLFAQPSHAALGAHLRQSGRRFFLEHSPAFLDAPGEWL